MKILTLGLAGVSALDFVGIDSGKLISSIFMNNQ